jgi:predicted component of viral defense system (DUF524 family)
MRLARSPQTWLAGLPGELMSLLVTLEAKITSYPPLSYKPDYSVGFARSAGVAAWDGKQYGTLSNDDIEWLDRAPEELVQAKCERRAVRDSYGDLYHRCA